MAEVHGKSGSITYSNLTAGVKGWTLNYTCDTAETTDLADSGVRTYIAGLTGWTATVEANFDNANTAAPGDSATLTLTVSTGIDYEGTAICTGLRVNTDVGGVDTVTYEFQGTGTLSVDMTA